MIGLRYSVLKGLLDWRIIDESHESCIMSILEMQEGRDLKVFRIICW